MKKNIISKNINKNKQGIKDLSQSNKRQLLKIFLIAVMGTLIVTGVVIAATIISYNKMVVNKEDFKIDKSKLSEKEKAKEEEKEERGELNKTIAVFGVDKEGLHTDVILVVNFNTITNKIKVLSIPRDTKVEWSDRQREKYTEITGNDRQYSKITEMYNHGMVYKEPGNIRYFTVDEIENILGVKVDNFIIIEIEAFREIVDAIGGVEVDVPIPMHYKDDCQGLYIDLEPGVQTLNGDTAEQFVRFRKTLDGGGYAGGDQGRVETQQIFLEAFAKKVMSPAIMGNLHDIVKSLFSHIKTDIELQEVFGYLDIVSNFKLENIEFYTAPGTSDDGGRWYFNINYDELEPIIYEMFYDTTVVDDEKENNNVIDKKEETDNSEEKILVDKDVSIHIYNNTDIKGLAAKLQTKLVEDGYDVDKVGNYTEGYIDGNTIFVKDKDKAKQFKKYLGDNTVVKENPDMECDIMMVIQEDLFL